MFLKILDTWRRSDTCIIIQRKRWRGDLLYYLWPAVDAAVIVSSEVPEEICLLSWTLAAVVRVSVCFGRSASGRWAGWGEVSGWRACNTVRPQSSRLNSFAATLTDHFRITGSKNIHFCSILTEFFGGFSHFLIISSIKTNKQSNISFPSSCCVYNATTYKLCSCRKGNLFAIYFQTILPSQPIIAFPL